MHQGSELVSIRPATPADVAALMSCERRPAYDDTVGRWSRDEHLAALADPSHRYLVALGTDGEVIGFVMLQDVGSPSGVVLVRRLAVMEQGRGTGRGLLEHALAMIFDELNAAKAWLKVWPHNARGIALYTSLGMGEDGRSEARRDGAPAWMTIMSIAAETFRDRQLRRTSP